MKFTDIMPKSTSLRVRGLGLINSNKEKTGDRGGREEGVSAEVVVGGDVTPILHTTEHMFSILWQRLCRFTS